MTSLTQWYHVITVRWRHASRERWVARHVECVQRLHTSSWSHWRTNSVRLATCPCVNVSHWRSLYDSLRRRSKSGFRTDGPSGRSRTRDWTWTALRRHCLLLVLCCRRPNSRQRQRSYRRSVTRYSWRPSSTPEPCLPPVCSNTGLRTCVSTTAVYLSCSVQSHHLHQQQQHQQQKQHRCCRLTHRLRSICALTYRPSSDPLSLPLCECSLRVSVCTNGRFVCSRLTIVCLSNV